MINRLVIAGVGLIGGSFALALKAAGQVGEVVGLGRTHGALDAALRLGVIDRIGADYADALAGADLVLLAMPVGQMGAAMSAMRPYLPPTCLVTDAGSTKGDVAAAARIALGDALHQFIPGHPIAGAEKSGAAAACADLFRDRRVVLTPLPENAAADVARIRGLWEACGARVSQLGIDEHDRVFAAVSHLPHLLAFALVDEFSMRKNSDQLFDFAAGGFRDFTRIASSHPEMWRDICISNRQPVLAELDAYLAQLMRTRVLLASTDGAGLEQMFSRARARRDEWLDAIALPGE